MNGQNASFWWMGIVLVLVLATAFGCTIGGGDDDDNDDTGDDDTGDDDTGDDDSGDDDAGDDDDDDDFQYEELFLTNCLINEPGEYVIRTQTEWDAFVGADLDHPGIEIDFDTQMVAGVVFGGGGCAAFGQIQSIQQNQDAVVFKYVAGADGPCFCYLMLPIFAIIDKSDLPVQFISPEKKAPLQSLDHTPLFMSNFLVDTESEFVIRTQEQWDAFIGYPVDRAKIAPVIDFDNQMVLGVVAGVGGCAGYGQIVDILEQDESILFQYDLGVGGMCECWLLTSLFAVTAKSDLPVDFEGPEL